MKKRIAIIGSTGTIGVQALDVIEAHKELFEVTLLSANNNSELLIEQAINHNVRNVVIGNQKLFHSVKEHLAPLGINVMGGNDSITQYI